MCSPLHHLAPQYLTHLQLVWGWWRPPSPWLQRSQSRSPHTLSRETGRTSGCCGQTTSSVLFVLTTAVCREETGQHGNECKGKKEREWYKKHCSILGVNLFISYNYMCYIFVYCDLDNSISTSKQTYIIRLDVSYHLMSSIGYSLLHIEPKVCKTGHVHQSEPSKKVT